MTSNYIAPSYGSKPTEGSTYAFSTHVNEYKPSYYATNAVSTATYSNAPESSSYSNAPESSYN